MADQTERLLLQVDAATELLRRNLGQAEQPLDRFERRASKMAENVDRSIADMGKRFPAFAQLAETAAQRAEKSFESSFNQVQRIAAQAIKGPTISGGINLGTNDLRAGAEEAQRQARSFALIGEAAERAALKVGDTSEATRLFIQATNASRIQAEQKAAALLAEAGALERVEIELRQSAEAADLFVTSHQRMAAAADAERQLAIASRDAAAGQAALAAQAVILRGDIDPMFAAQQRFNAELDRADALLKAGAISQREYAMATQIARDRLYAHAQALTSTVKPSTEVVRSQGAIRSAMQGLSFQAQDTFTQLSMGANVFQVLAIQGGQAAGQFANVEGKAGNFARFLIGPYGLAITAALLVLGPLVDKTIEFSTASENSAAAAETHRVAMAALDEAVNRLNQSQARLNHTTRQGIQDDLNAAEAKRQHIIRTRQLIDAQLNEAKGQLTAAQITQAQGGGTVPGSITGAAGIQAAAARQRIEAIEGAQRINDRKMQEANTAIAAGRAQIVLRDVAARTDKATAANQRYEDSLNRLQRKFEKGGFGNPNSAAAQRAFGAEAERVTRENQADQDRIREANKKGPRGPSAETLARRAESARVRLLNQDTAFTEEERTARRKLLDATRKTAASEDERDALMRDDINAEAEATARKITNNLSAKKIDDAQAERLTDLNEKNQQQRLDNVKAERASRDLDRRYAAEEDELQARLAMMRIGEDLAGTERERRRIARQILDAEQQLRRQALERVRDTSQDPDAVLRAKNSLARLPDLEQAENRQFDRGNATPIEQYRDRLKAATDDMGTAVQDAAVRGFGALEESGSRATASAITNLLHLKGIAGDVIGGVIADLARLAIQKAIVSAIGGSFFGFADGGSIGEAPGFADGGSPGGLIRGPGTSRSDSILALLKGPNGRPVRLSTREFIMNGAAVEYYGPALMQAMNARRLPRFAEGGSLGGPQVPTFGLRSPRLPDLRGRGRDRMQVDVRTKVEASPLLMAKVEETSVRTVSAAAEPIMAGAQTRTVRGLNRPQLPGGLG